ncbi:hypothetical protein [Saccharothrix australiensis]|uniref:Uncharacterized protein n=1 Tax=Saccharothrix australiensis TaxID=2072 RepID=A0A495VKE5_9PSEU|nr:hypothetical protein [Saccharothrix australiensis]RKT49270.1 hypothetical protein C8E97_6766 [Saccharothrix australiensis]RKT49370.1 hypothetical protein C8E97_6749 [Saccharothrix australiensis]
MSEPQAPMPIAFDPSTSKATTGPTWHSDYVKASLHRIRSSSVDQAVAQAMTEQVVLLHSIRRILVWTLIIVPTVVVALGVVVWVAADSQSSATCGGVYSSRC